VLVTTQLVPELVRTWARVAVATLSMDARTMPQGLGGGEVGVMVIIEIVLVEDRTCKLLTVKTGLPVLVTRSGVGAGRGKARVAALPKTGCVALAGTEMLMIVVIVLTTDEAIFADGTVTILSALETVELTC
jgi:hypothetical protein